MIIIFFFFWKSMEMIVQGIGKKTKSPDHTIFFFMLYVLFLCEQLNRWTSFSSLSHSVSYFYQQAERGGGKWTQFQMFQTLSLFQSFDQSVSASLCFCPAFDPRLSLLLMAGYRPVSIFNFHPSAGEYLVNKTNINDSNNDSGVNLQCCPYTIAQYNFFPHFFPLFQL